MKKEDPERPVRTILVTGVRNYETFLAISGMTPEQRGSFEWYVVPVRQKERRDRFCAGQWGGVFGKMSLVMIPTNIQKSHLLAAIAEIDRAGIPPHQESTRYDLVSGRGVLRVF